jgi:hypothetical protein
MAFDDHFDRGFNRILQKSVSISDGFSSHRISDETHFTGSDMDAIHEASGFGVDSLRFFLLSFDLFGVFRRSVSSLGFLSSVAIFNLLIS